VVQDGIGFVLLVNDDGIEAPGLHALAAALGELPGVRLALVAPAKNRTGSGTQIDFGPLTVLAHPPVHGWPAWAVDGSPLDAVSVGIQGLFREMPPDLVVSGVNQGLNLGRLAMHSGTVGAAIRSVLLGIPALAVSCQTPRTPVQDDFCEAAHLARRLLALWLADGGMPASVDECAFLSLNVPRGYNGGVRWTRLGRRYFRLEQYRPDPDGVTFRPVLVLDSLEPHAAEALSEPEDTDVGALAHGYATLTPLHAALFAPETHARLPADTAFHLPPLFPAAPPAAEDRPSLPPEAEVRE
jgi:5'-nucleotidase